MHHGRVRLAVLVGIAIVSAAGCAGTERFPSAPILLVCPWAAGGGSDRVARQLAVLLEEDLDVPVNVINVTGGDGVTGHSRGALAPADGYTITLITVEIATLHWRQMTSISYRDFIPIGLVNRDAAAVFVRSDAPWKTLRDLERAIAAAPGRMRASGTATAGIWHLAMAGWLDTVNLAPTDVIWVSIAGSAPSLAELMAGGIDFVVCSLPEARALLDSGRIRSLGVMADERLAQFASVPTLKEQGIDFALGTIRGVAVPQSVAPGRVRVLAEAVERVARSKAYVDTMAAAGFTPAYEDPRQVTRTLEDTDARLGALLRSDAFAALAEKQIGLMFFPGVLFASLAVVTLTLIVLSRTRRDVPNAGEPAVLVPQAFWRFLEPLLWIALYVAIVEWAGYLLTAGALLVLYLWRLGTRLRVALPLGLVLVPATYYVFAVLLRVSLPRGLLGW
jgi:tripartite-type tricarboxylate transporter receptor subunit TctC